MCLFMWLVILKFLSTSRSPELESPAFHCHCWSLTWFYKILEVSVSVRGHRRGEAVGHSFPGYRCVVDPVGLFTQPCVAWSTVSVLHKQLATFFFLFRNSYRVGFKRLATYSSRNFELLVVSDELCVLIRYHTFFIHPSISFFLSFLYRKDITR